MTLEERLNEIIEEKDAEIANLTQKIDDLEDKLDISSISWQKQEIFEENDFNRNMPYPRLEMRLRQEHKGNWFRVQYHYGLVYRHYSNTGSDKVFLLFIPISITSCGGGRDNSLNSWMHNGELTLPYRDGVHIKSESRVFNLPAFITCEQENIIQMITFENEYREGISLMRRKGKL